MTVARIPTPFSKGDSDLIYRSSVSNTPTDFSIQTIDSDGSSGCLSPSFRPIVCPDDDSEGEGRISLPPEDEPPIHNPCLFPESDSSPIHSPNAFFDESDRKDSPAGFLNNNWNKQIVPAHLTNRSHFPIQFLYSTIFQIRSEAGPTTSTETEIKGYSVETVEIINSSDPQFASPPLAMRALRGKVLHVTVQDTGAIATQILARRSLTPPPGGFDR